MKIAIVDYNAGNVCSVLNAVRRIGVEPSLTRDAAEICSADKVIFPGQGEAAGTMRFLRDTGLDRVIAGLRQPVLGICIGMQLLCRHSDEGDTDCMGVFDADVQRFAPQRHEDKVPHMGWNSLRDMQGPLFTGLDDGAYVYFVHSYYVPLCGCTVATCDYIQPFSAALQRGNFYATQFHPEKSGSVGERILQNFLAL